MYKWDNALYKDNVAYPYVRWQEYNGGKKHRTNSPFNVVRELEVGLEYQFSRALELTVAYAWMQTHGYSNCALSHPRWRDCPFSIAVEFLTTASGEAADSLPLPARSRCKQQTYGELTPS